MIQQISQTEFSLTKGNNQMTLSYSAAREQWMVCTYNPSTRAWNGRNWPSHRFFNSLAEVEQAYKSWRGICALVEAA